MDKLDPDFAPASDHEEDTFLIETTSIDDNIYLVYGSCLKKRFVIVRNVGKRWIQV